MFSCHSLEYKAQPTDWECYSALDAGIASLQKEKLISKFCLTPEENILTHASFYTIHHARCKDATIVVIASLTTVASFLVEILKVLKSFWNVHFMLAGLLLVL